MAIQRYVIENDDSYSVPPQVTDGSPEINNNLFRANVNRDLARVMRPAVHSPWDAYERLLKVLTRYNLSIDTHGSQTGPGAGETKHPCDDGVHIWTVAQFGQPTGYSVRYSCVTVGGGLSVSARIVSGDGMMEQKIDRLKSVMSESTRVRSNNLAHGYYGAVEHSGKNRDREYSSMHRKVKNILSSGGHIQDEKTPNKKIKHFLDSTHGRHIAYDRSDKNIIGRWKHFSKSYSASDY